MTCDFSADHPKYNDDKMNEEEIIEARAVIYAQTSVLAVTATTGGHGGEPKSPLRVASGHTFSAVVKASHGGRNQDVSNKLPRMDAVVDSDSDLDSVKTITSKDERELLSSPVASKGALFPSRDRPKRSKEGLKALAEYKAAVRIQHRLGPLANLSQAEKERLLWATGVIESSRAHFSKRTKYAAKDPAFPNCIEEGVIKSILEKRQRSVDESPTSRNPTDTKKRKQHHEDARPSTSKAAAEPLPKIAKISEVAKRHLSVALLDASNSFGQMTKEQWKIVESAIFNEIVAQMEAEPERPLPSFDGAGWFNGVKLIKCKDDATLEWVKGVVSKLKGLWKNAQLKIVDRASIPAIPKAKVTIPRIVKPEVTLRLLQSQNPDIPTKDWKILHVDKGTKDGQNYILQITEDAEDILYPRYGKMSWGVGSVFLRLKKRHPKDSNHNTLGVDEVERDLAAATAATAGLILGDMAVDIEAVPERETLDDSKDPADQPPAQ